MFKKLAQQLKAQNSGTNCFPMSSPVQPLEVQAKKAFLKNLSKQALDLYERKSDVNNFTKLVVSDSENDSHKAIMDELFGKEGFVDPFDETNLFNLSENKRFLEDLGL
ncbi:hypothetical protein HDR58_00440 [bacterium]|nr:hypothetical protein [bacterium]